MILDEIFHVARPRQGIRTARAVTEVRSYATHHAWVFLDHVDQRRLAIIDTLLISEGQGLVREKGAMSWAD